MELEKAIDVLQEFNDYRRSNGKWANENATIRDLQYSPKEIGDAIDLAIGLLKTNQQLNDKMNRDLSVIQKYSTDKKCITYVGAQRAIDEKFLNRLDSSDKKHFMDREEKALVSGIVECLVKNNLTLRTSVYNDILGQLVLSTKLLVFNPNNNDEK